MSAANSQRKKMFVSLPIQGGMILKLSMYWFVYHIVLWHVMFLFQFISSRVYSLSGSEILPINQMYSSFLADHTVMLLAAVIVLPFILIDIMCYTHRITGPVVRFRDTLQKMTRGEPVKSIQLRKKDFMTDLQDDFNKFIEKVYEPQRKNKKNSRDVNPQYSQVKEHSGARATHRGTIDNEPAKRTCRNHAIIGG